MATSMLILFGGSTKAYSLSLLSDSVITRTDTSIHVNIDSLFNTWDTCLTPNIRSITPVFYSDEIRVAIDIAFDTAFSPDFKLWQRIDSVTRTLISSTVELDGMSYLQYNSLAPLLNYELEATSTCGPVDYFEIGVFNTSPQADTPSIIEVSDRMFFAFETWNDSAHDTLDLYTYFNSDNSLHYLEKISLVQKWVFNGLEIDVNLAGPDVKTDFLDVYDYGFGTPTISGNCFCSQFRLSGLAMPRTGKNLPNGDIEPTNYRAKQRWAGGGYIASYWGSYLGPSKYTALAMDDESAGSTTHHVSAKNIDTDISSARYAVVKLTYNPQFRKLPF